MVPNVTYQVLSIGREGLLVLLGGGRAVERGYRGRHQQQPRRGQHNTSHRNHDDHCVKALLRSHSFATVGLKLQVILQRSKKWLVRGLVKFATAVARLVCPVLLG